MNRRIAALLLARRHPDWDVLEAHMGKRKDTLRKELTGQPGYKWGVDDEDMLIDPCEAVGVSDPLAPLTAALLNRGVMFLKLPTGVPDDSPTFQCLAAAAKDFGEFMVTASSALADGKVSLNELKDIEKEFGELVAKGQTCLASMRVLHEAGKPSSSSSSHN